jgi:uroporphyrinogen-III decarboxylase
MVSSEDRILNAMELGDPIDKIPKMELFASILPAMKVILNWDVLPLKIRKLNRKWKILEETINTAKENWRMRKVDPTERHTLYGRLIRKASFINDLIASNLNLLNIAQHSPEKVDKDAVRLASLYARVPIKLGYDLWTFPSITLPDSDGGFQLAPDGNYYPTTKEGVFADISSYDLEALFKGAVEKNVEKSIANSKEFYESAQLERYAAIVERVMNSKYKMRKIKDQLLPAILHPGPFETWITVFGTDNMQGFYRYVFKEYRNGCKGIYSDLLKVKTDMLCHLVKCIAEIDMKVFVIGDDCAQIHGSFLPPKIYRDFMAVHIKKIVDTAHRVGMKVLFHTDGKFKVENKKTLEETWEFMNTILNMGIDALHPIEMWANDIEELKRTFGDRICICNGINTIELQTGTRHSVAQLTKNILDKVYRGGGNRLNGYIAGSDNSIMAGCQPYLVRQMIYTINDYGKKILNL